MWFPSRRLSATSPYLDREYLVLRIGEDGRHCTKRRPHAGDQVLPRGCVTVPIFAGARELILQSQEIDNRGDGIGGHARCRHLALRVVDRGFGGRDSRAGDADQKCNVFCADGGQRHDPSRLAYTDKSDLRVIDIAACPQVLESRHDVAGQVSERGRFPVPRRSADSALIVAKHGDAVADEEARKGKHMLAILRPRAMHDNNGGILAAGPWADQSTRKFKLAARKAHLVPRLDLNPTRGAGSAGPGLPYE